jgi:hypothetical protein
MTANVQSSIRSPRGGLFHMTYWEFQFGASLQLALIEVEWVRSEFKAARRGLRTLPCGAFDSASGPVLQRRRIANFFAEISGFERCGA